MLRETQPLESLRSHLVGRGGKASGPWASQLLATWRDIRLCSPSSRTPQNHLMPPVLGEQRSRVHKPQRTRTWLQQGARTLCFFIGYTSRAKERERRKNPTGKRSWLSPWTEMASKALKPTPGQIVSKVFPNQKKKRSKSGSDCEHKRRWRMLNAVNWWSFKE